MRHRRYLIWMMPLLFPFLLFNGYGHFLIHSFMHHQDTVDRRLPDGWEGLDSMHVHCEILHIHLQPSTPSTVFHFLEKIIFEPLADRLIPVYELIAYIHFSQRGPPIA